MNRSDLRSFLPELELIWNALVRRDDIPNHVDAIVVGGCRDLGLAEHTAELFHAGISNVIVMSGYQPEGLKSTEAELLASECLKLGVPSESIILEKEASNTGQNILFSAKIIQDILGDIESVILIHKPYMSLRFLSTAEAQWPTPQPRFFSTCQNISFDQYWKIHGIEEVSRKMLGDFKRMDEYASKGFQSKQHLPENARLAFNKIINSGVTIR